MPPPRTQGQRLISVPSTREAADALLPLIAAAQSRASASPRAAPATVFVGPVVLVDGRSGSGKSDLAAALGTALDATLVHLDDIYPGWLGLDAASRHVHQHLLSGEAPRWQRYDWAAQRTAEWASVDPALPLIVEGIGSVSTDTVQCATIAVWLELDDSTRRRRALERDGAAYEPHWALWAEQEDAFIARESPQNLADVVVDFRSPPGR